MTSSDCLKMTLHNRYCVVGIFWSDPLVEECDVLLIIMVVYNTKHIVGHLL